MLRAYWKVLKLFLLVSVTLGAGIAAEALLSDEIPAIREILDFLNARPVYWIAVGMILGALAFISGVQGFESERRAAEARLNDKLRVLEATVSGLRRELGGLQAALTESRRSAGLDPLTELPKQSRLRDELEALFAQGQAAEYVLIYIDLVATKTVNDTQGEDFGDIYIRECATLLHNEMQRKEKMFVRESRWSLAEEGAAVVRAREGGDEFFLLIRGEPLGAMFFIKRLAAALRREGPRILAQSRNPAGLGEMSFSPSFRGGLVDLADCGSPEEAFSEVRDAYFEVRKAQARGASRPVFAVKPTMTLGRKEAALLAELQDALMRDQ